MTIPQNQKQEENIYLFPSICFLGDHLKGILTNLRWKRAESYDLIKLRKKEKKRIIKSPLESLWWPSIISKNKKLKIWSLARYKFSTVIPYWKDKKENDSVGSDNTIWCNLDESS